MTGHTIKGIRTYSDRVYSSGSASASALSYLRATRYVIIKPCLIDLSADSVAHISNCADEADLELHCSRMSEHLFSYNELHILR